MSKKINSSNKPSKKSPKVKQDSLSLVTPPILSQEHMNVFASNFGERLIQQATEIQNKLVYINTPTFDQLNDTIDAVKLLQDTVFNIASIYQNTVRDIVLSSGIMQIANTFNSIQIEAFAGLYITSEFKDRYETEQNGILEVSTVKQLKLLTNGQVRVDFDKSTQSNVKAEVAYQKIDQIHTKLDFMDENLSSTKEDTRIIKAMLKDERGLLQVLQNNPFPYFKIASIKFIKGSSILRVNNQIVIKLPQYSNMESLCTILFSGDRELGESWSKGGIIEGWADLIDSEEADRMKWKTILSTVNNINTLFAKRTTKENLILTERPNKIRLNPEYF